MSIPLSKCVYRWFCLSCMESLDIVHHGSRHPVLFVQYLSYQILISPDVWRHRLIFFLCLTINSTSLS